MGDRSVFSSSTIELKGYALLFQDGHMLFMFRGFSSNAAMVLELERAMCIGRMTNLCEP
jgi:hypothetical protein